MTVSDVLAATATPYTPPSEISGVKKQVQGVAYQAVGLVSQSWQDAGKELYAEGQKEAEKARFTAKGDSTLGGLHGAAQSVAGMWTQDRDKLSEGELRTHDAEWEGALADHTMPQQSFDRLKGKVESAVGMTRGDYDQQAEGAIKAGKAALRE